MVLRAGIAAAYVAVQVTLIATSGLRADHAFGFQMFRESVTARLALLREVDAPSGHGTVVVAAHGGEWVAEDTVGRRHAFEWQARVKTPVLSTFDVTFEAGYGARAELSRLQAALDDVASHIDGDAETRRLLLDVTLRQNGREPTVVRLTSAPRARAATGGT